MNSFVDNIVDKFVDNSVDNRRVVRWRLWGWIVLCIGLVLLGMHLWVPRPLFDNPTSTVVVDRNGELIGARISKDQQWRFPESDSIPSKFEQCIIAYEDRRFRYHWGVDPVAAVRALVHNVRQGRVTEGGSTITMQVARMARGNRPRTLAQKFVEALWALDIECRYSKRDILRLYASNAPFGGNTVGIDAAAWRYFGRSAQHLSWAENATLAVLPNAPSLIHLSRNRESLKFKRDALLYRLKEDGTISQQEYELSLCEPLPQAPLPIPNQAPHLLARLASHHEGERVVCTVDVSLQKMVQQIADRYSTRYKANYISDIAILVADVESGQVMAYVGNSSQQTTTSQVDNTISQRSTGSLLKPILYAAMLTDGEITPQMIFADTPLNLNGFTPMNFNRTYRGVVPADEAVTRSLNVPLVRMLSQYGIGRFMSVLRWLGMTTLRFDEDHYGASIILGGAEGTLWDMTGMYASMSRMLKGEGQRSKVKGQRSKVKGQRSKGEGQRSRVEGQKSKVKGLSLMDNGLRDTQNGLKQPATRNSRLSLSSIWYAYEAMSALNRPEEEADWQTFSSMKRVAWKTGTSWGSRDAWAIGTTPRYAVGVWVGNSTGEGRAGLTGVGYAAPVMFDVYTLLDNVPWFDEPLSEMIEAKICRHSGHIASSICGETETRLVPASCISTRQCPYCRLVHLSADGLWQVNSSGESVSRIRTESRFVLPPIPEYYFASHTASYQPLPPLRPDCQIEAKEQISIITPEHRSSVVLPRSFGGEAEKIVLKAACHDAEATLFWHLDDQYIGQTHGRHEMAVLPSVGQHSLTVIDDHGNRRTVIFAVK